MSVSENVVSRLVNRNGRTKKSAPISPAQRLSDRELEIFRSFGEGRSTQQIAAKLRIAISTVESHRASIKHKLKLANATELVSAAARYVAEEHRT
jgi:DNA-binding CsgD family transcriptional regulator